LLDIKPGMVLTHINSVPVLGRGDYLQKSTDALKEGGDVRPLHLMFADAMCLTRTFMQPTPVFTSTNDDHDNDNANAAAAAQYYGCPSEELILGEARRSSSSEGDMGTSVVITRFEDQVGPIEGGGALCGDVLIAVNGIDFGIVNPKDEDDGVKGDPTKEAKKLLEVFKGEEHYPMTLSFARPDEGDLHYIIKLPLKAELGVTFQRTPKSSNKVAFSLDGQTEREYLSIAAFRGITGPCKKLCLRLESPTPKIIVGLSVVKINGHHVPTQSKASAIKEALRRGWIDNGGSVEVGFKDLEQEGWLEGFIR
jgi:hypothetical protein